MSNFGSDTPFMLIARLKVKEGKVNEYFEIADKTDKAVEASEPGMLHHTLDQVPEDPLSFYSQRFLKMMMHFFLIWLIHLSVLILKFMLDSAMEIYLLNFMELLEIK